MALEPIKIGTQGLDAKTKKIIEIIAADEENRKYKERCSGQKSISDVYQKSAQRAAENKEPGLLRSLLEKWLVAKYNEGLCSGQKSISDVYQKSAQRAAENKEPGLLERLVAWVKSFF